MSIKPTQICLFLAVSIAVTAYSCSAQTPGATPQAPATISDKDPGWIWDQMTSCVCPEPSPASAHAGGPGSSATYIFTGSGIEVFSISERELTVGSAAHRTGKVRITIDGQSKGEFAEYTPGQTAGAALFSIHGLPEKNHSLLIEAVDGWASVSSITVDHSTFVADTSIPPGTYRISSRIATDKCVDVLGYSSTPGTHMDLYPYLKQTNQQFQFSKAGPGKYHIRPLSVPGAAISILPGADGNPPFVGIWNDIGNPAQVWSITVTPSGYYRLSPCNAPSEALTCGDPQVNTADIPIKPYVGMPNQDWEIVPISADN